MNNPPNKNNNTKVILLGLLALVLMAAISSADPDMPPLENNIELPEKLSDHHIFEGPAAALKPALGFHPYQLATTLFTDYAEKQRLIKVPQGAKLTGVGDGLPEFPDGTVLVKTFFYYNDKRKTAKGKQIIETRLMIKTNGQWSAGTYQWNKEQTEAYLVTKGVNTPVTWLDDEGNSQAINYHIPKTKECASCHNRGNTFTPIGPKIANLNRDVTTDKGSVNQLVYLQQSGVLKQMEPSGYNKLPDWRNTSLPLADRARAYLDVNCGHCHSDEGYCSNSRLKLNFDMELDRTRIASHAEQIERFMTKKRMPMLGTTVVDKEGLELIRDYINTLN